MSRFDELAHFFDPDCPPGSDEPLCPIQGMDILSEQQRLGMTQADLDAAIRMLTRGRLSGEHDLNASDADLLLSRLKAARRP